MIWVDAHADFNTPDTTPSGNVHGMPLAAICGRGGRLADVGGINPKVREEIDEAGEAIAAGDRDRIREELGDVLFSLVNAARLASIDAEDALHGATEKFRRRFTEMEAELSAQGKSVENVPQAELERAWEAAKAAERRR